MMKANTVPKLSFKTKIIEKSNASCNLEKIVSKPVATNRTEFEEVNLDEYERIRNVGQGSFGVAVLYLRRTDNTKVVLKQICLTDSSFSERELAMNEVNVFSKLHHPNIISYLGSFIKDNVLMIEMEFADAGTLAQLIARQGVLDYFPERFILKIFEQITSAINYMHCENILHRDLKTANVFMKRFNIVKLGDFGIAKVIDTMIQAQTVLGTPYYLSPEMCEGKIYDSKSDIWALGCILGEMCCLRKAFSATNLSELVSKIMSAKYMPLPSGYSTGINTLLSLIVQVEMTSRPSASEILSYWLPLVYRNLGKRKGHKYEHNYDTVSTSSSVDAFSLQSVSTFHLNSNYSVRERSVLYQLKAFGSSFTLTPVPLPPNLKVKTVAGNESHFVAVGEDGSVHVWGQGSKGQLGLSCLEAWKHYPGRMKTIQNHHIVGACAGNEFTILWSATGTVFSCGSNKNGCLGQGDRKHSYVPQLIETLICEHIVEVFCGEHHVVALAKDGSIFTWGTSIHGALGQGLHDIYLNLPQAVQSITILSRVKRVCCGPDTTLILAENGDVYGCGSNSFGKLGFSSKFSKLMTFKRIPLNARVVDVSISATHSAFLIEGGYVVTMGGNNDGQRGVGHTNVVKMPTLVHGIHFKCIKQVKCYETYTIVCSQDNVISFWGTRNSIQDAKECSTSSHDMKKNSWVPNIDLSTNTDVLKDFLAKTDQTELILDPVDILAVHASKEQVIKGYNVNVANMLPLYHSFLILVNTTVPLVKGS